MKRLEISDKDSDGALNFDFAKVLASLPSTAKAYERWCFKELEAVGENILRMEEAIKASSDGLCMGWDELATFSLTIEEVMNLTLVAGDRVTGGSASWEELLRIEVIDSTIWAVETDAVPIQEWVRSSFSQVSDAGYL